MKLNVRAILQVLRNQGLEIGATCAADMELSDTKKEDTTDDELILGKNEEVRGWNWLSTNVDDLQDVDDDEDSEVENGDGMKEPVDAIVGNELLKRKEGTAERLTRETNA